MAGYSGFRIFEETLRIDYSNYILGERLNFWIASLLCLAGLLWFVGIQRRWRPPWVRGEPEREAEQPPARASTRKPPPPPRKRSAAAGRGRRR